MSVNKPPTIQPPAVQPVEGKTSIDQGMFFESEFLSYKAAQTVARQVAEQIRESVTGKSVVLVDEMLMADLANLEAVYLWLDEMRQEYDQLTKSARTLSAATADAPASHMEGDAAGLTAIFNPITAGVSTALGLLSLFREETEYHGRKNNIDATSLRLMLAGAIRENPKVGDIILPRLLAPEFAPSDRANSLKERLARTYQAKQNVWDLLKEPVRNLASLDARLDQAARAGNQPEVDRLSQELTDRRRELDPFTDAMSQIAARLDRLEAQWQQVDEKSGLSLLARFLRAEAISDRKPVYLYAEVVSAGGSYRVRRSLLHTLFTGDGLSFSGGVVIAWAILDRNGTILKSRIEEYLIPFQRFNRRHG